MSDKNGKKVERNADGTFKEGHEGLGGRPKGSSNASIVKELKEILAKPSDPTDVNSPAKKTQLAHKMIDQAIEDGDNKTIKMIVEQIDGKPTQKTDITTGGEKINKVSNEQLEELIRLRDKRKDSS